METLKAKKEQTTQYKKNNSSFFKPFIQKKLSVGSANDSYEIEADQVADKVMKMSEPSPQITHSGALLQRKCAHCEQEEKLQMKPLAESISPLIQRSSSERGGVASSHVENQINSSRGGGSVMDSRTKNFMENRFGADFSDVKIHTGSQAVQMSRELNAQAFAVGNDIYFNEGKYNPNSDSGKHLLAHELTHTVQQGGGVGRKIQKSCFDGNCETCGGGIRRLWYTVYFRTRATRETMRILREKINEAKRILRNCCIDARFNFDWRLLRGGGTFDWGSDPTGSNYSDEARDLGEGHTFDSARGTPMIVADTIPGTGGGVTVTPATDTHYSGPTYIAISVSHGKLRAIAHETGHVGGILTHTTVANIMDSGTSTNVDERFCNSARGI